MIVTLQQVLIHTIIHFRKEVVYYCSGSSHFGHQLLCHSLVLSAMMAAECTIAVKLINNKAM